MNRTYLGDSVYAEYSERGILLTTNNGYRDDPRNRIFLEPEVLAAFLRWIGQNTKISVSA